MPGKLIVFEGLDRSGKTTQCKIITSWMNKNVGPTEMIRFPNRESETGKLIDAVLSGSKTMNNESLHLLFAANRWEEKERMDKLISQGIHTICDRYSESGIAYSVARGLNYDWCCNTEKGLHIADLILFLEIPIDTIEKRMGYGKEITERAVFQEKVREAYKTIQSDKRLGEKYVGMGTTSRTEDRWIKINANQSYDLVTDEIISELQKRLE